MIVVSLAYLTFACRRSKATAPAALARVRLSFFHDLSMNNPLSGAPNENIVQNHLNIALLNVF